MDAQTKIFILGSVCVLFLIWVYRKASGKPGTWNNENSIKEYALLMNSTNGSFSSDTVVPPLNESAVNPQEDNDGLDGICDVKKREINVEFCSKGEKISKDFLEKYFKKPFVKIKPSFLKNPITNSNLELDCYNDELKLALEYQGRQHYEYVSKFHTSKSDFLGQKYRDEIKRRLCFEKGIDLIEVPYSIKHENIPKYIENALKKIGY